MSNCETRAHFFVRNAARLGELAPDACGSLADRVQAAQWLLPWETGAPETSEFVHPQRDARHHLFPAQPPDRLLPVVQAVAAFADGSAAARAVVAEVNARFSPSSDPQRYVARWL